MTASLAAVDHIPGDGEDLYPKSVLRKANLILAAFSAGPRQLRLTELSERAGVPKASAYRVAQELVHWGFLRRIGDGYELGLRVFELGQQVPSTAALRSAARPMMLDLFAATRGTLHLAVPDGNHVFYIDKLAGRGGVLYGSEVGGRMPMSCTASGKVLLAHDPGRREILSHYETHGMTRFTTCSADDVAQLSEELERVRRNGYSVESQEVVPRFGSVASPVTADDGHVVAALSITVPVSNVRSDKLISLLRSTANDISHALARRPAGSMARGA